MRFNPVLKSGGVNSSSAIALSVYVSVFQLTVLLICPNALAQEQKSTAAKANNERCEELLKQPLTTLDLNGDGTCDEADVSLFQALVSSCERERISKVDRVEKLDLDCDRCITRQDVETFRSYCEKAAGTTKQSGSSMNKTNHH
jgi:hypothetical protein